ncbi:MAG: hypothetical protein QW385_00695 [Thermoproteota archaeon]
MTRGKKRNKKLPRKVDNYNKFKQRSLRFEVSRLINLLEERDYDKIKVEDLPILIRLLDEDVIKSKVAYAIGRIAEKHHDYKHLSPAVVKLIELLNDKNVETRGNAIFALGEIASTVAINPIMKMLDDNAVFVFINPVDGKPVEKRINDQARESMAKIKQKKINASLLRLAQENPDVKVRLLLHIEEEGLDFAKETLKKIQEVNILRETELVPMVSVETKASMVHELVKIPFIKMIEESKKYHLLGGES